MRHKTQMQAARQGILTQAMVRVLEKETAEESFLLEGLAHGRIVVPANINHKKLDAIGIGEGLSTKINVNLGISQDCCDLDAEWIKVEWAMKLKADAIMDLSCYGKTREFRQKLVTNAACALGTVPIYDAMGFLDKELAAITSDDFFQVVENHAVDGVDFMTIHAGINQATAAVFGRNPRLTQIVSRGGALLYAWMVKTGRENPFFKEFDRLLEICQKYDVTLSLGDACRPGSLKDSSDASQIHELIVLGELTLRAWEQGVQVMIEGPGHMAANEIGANMMMAKKLCHGAPIYVLGPLVTDVAPGYDHITSAIGGTIAAMNGADFLCYVTPSEHLRLPDLNDMKEGIMASRIAAHAADVALGIPGAGDWDNRMSQARARLDWEAMFSLALDEEKARAYRASSLPEEENTCTMCGKMCAINTMKKVCER